MSGMRDARTAKGGKPRLRRAAQRPPAACVRGSSAILLASLLLLGALTVVLAAAAPARALPEYSAQTGEPCATCHNSPSGGGIRTPRGQAWVADGRPGAAPDLSEALALLGVTLNVNEADFVAPGAAREPAGLPATAPVDTARLREWLNRRGGN